MMKVLLFFLLVCTVACVLTLSFVPNWLTLWLIGLAVVFGLAFFVLLMRGTSIPAQPPVLSQEDEQSSAPIAASEASEQAIEALEEGQVPLFAKWSEEFATHVETIDEQHRMLFNYVNKLYDAIQGGSSATELQEVLDALTGYAFTHFSTEEILFSHSDYPDKEKHLQVHEAFRAKVANFQDALSHGKANVDMELLIFLRDWLIHHIQGMDVTFAPYLQEGRTGTR